MYEDHFGCYSRSSRMDFYSLNYYNDMKFQRDDLNFDPKFRTNVQEFNSPQVKRQETTEYQDSKKEWIKTVTSDEFKRDFFNQPIRISLGSLKPKYREEDYISSEYSVSSGERKQTKYKAIIIAVLFISILMVLAVSGAIVFIFRFSDQNDKNLPVSTINAESTKSTSISSYSMSYPSTTLKITKNTTLPTKAKIRNPSTTKNQAPSTAITGTESILTITSKEDNSITETTETKTPTEVISLEPITTDTSSSDTGSSSDCMGTTNEARASDETSTFSTSFQTTIRTIIDGTTSIDNTNTNNASPIAKGTASLTTNMTTVKSNPTTNSTDANATSSAAVITYTVKENISRISKEKSTITKSTVSSVSSIISTQKNFTSKTQIPVTTTLIIPSPYRQETPHLRSRLSTYQTHPVKTTSEQP